MNHYSDSEHNILTIKTVQTTPFRLLMTALKDMLLETNITFSPDGMRIVNMDKSHTILVHLFLAAENFEFYECKKDKIIIGVNVTHLFTLLPNNNEKNEVMTIYIENTDYSEGIVSFLSLKHENGEIRQCKIQKLRLIEPEPDELEYPNVAFPSTIILPASGFHKIIHNLSAISDRVEIKSVGSELIFKCEGQFASAKLHRSELDGSMSFSSKPEASKIIQGVFSLKHLGYFIKCTELSEHVELHLENDLPLVVKYKVRSLGELKLCLAQLPS